MRVKLINLETGRCMFTCTSWPQAVQLQLLMTEFGYRVVFDWVRK